MGEKYASRPHTGQISAGAKPEERWHKLNPAEMPTISFQLMPTEEELEQWHKLDPSEIPGPIVSANVPFDIVLQRLGVESDTLFEGDQNDDHSSI